MPFGQGRSGGGRGKTDKDKKGVMVPDVVAAEFLHLNPPKNA